MASGKFNLLSDASATGAATYWPGGPGTFSVVGTFGGATVKLQYLGPDDSTYIDVDSVNASFTSAGICGFELGSGMIRAAVSGGSPSGLYASAVAYGE